MEAFEIALAITCAVGFILGAIALRSRRKVRLALPEPARRNGRAPEIDKHLRAYVAEAEGILTMVRDLKVDDVNIEIALSDYHSRMLLYLLRNLGAYFARHVHAHDGVRTFGGAYAANVPPERLRTIRHVETDIRRLNEFLGIVGRAFQDGRPLPSEEDEEEAEPADWHVEAA
jgi:hypothetical protein